MNISVCLVQIAEAAMKNEVLQRKKAFQGRPYQTLIANVLHKYVSGQLTEKKPA